MWGSTVRGSWRPNITATFWSPLLWPSTLCLSHSPDAQPEARGLTLLAFSTTSYQQLLWTPTHQGPFGRVWLSLPHLVYNSVRSLTVTATSVLTELYNSPTPTQSPTRFLESHVWSSLSGNNCHAVHRSLSSDASVNECTMGIFLPRPISSANFRSHDFLSYLLLECVTSFQCITLELHFWPGWRPKYIKSSGQSHSCSQKRFGQSWREASRHHLGRAAAHSSNSLFWVLIWSVMENSWEVTGCATVCWGLQLSMFCQRAEEVLSEALSVVQWGKEDKGLNSCVQVFKSFKSSL